MNYIHAENFETGAHELAARISTSLKENKRVLWLVTGGSNITAAVQVMNTIRNDVPIGSLVNLTVALTDERYGPVGHPDSNWEQLEENGFNFDNIAAIPVLRGLPFEETAAAYGKDIVAAFERTDIRIAQFGIGPDGHIAGILPHTPSVTATEPALAYVATKFQRITLTPAILANVTVAFALAFGAAKKDVLLALRDSSLSLDDEPAQILKLLPEAYVFSDQY